MTDALRAVWSDLRAMPVGKLENKVLDVAYEDGWMDARGDQGERRHEGTDLFCRESGRETPAEGGIYPVVSMTDGYVENIGWLNLEAGGSASAAPPEDTFIMPICRIMPGIFSRENRSAPGSCWDLWATQATVRRAPKACFACICIWAFISPQRERKSP